MRHIRFALWTLFGFMSLGLFLEYMLGFKSEVYLGMDSEVRRLMWRLSHAHGSLTGLIHLGYGLLAYTLPASATRRRGTVSLCLMAGTFLLPGGFFLGGFGVVDGDPGMGVFLAPLGAAALLLACFIAALDATFAGNSNEAGSHDDPGSAVDNDSPKDSWSA